MPFKDSSSLRKQHYGTAVVSTFAAIVVLTLWGWFVVLTPMPSKMVIMATGSEGGIYKGVGARYQDIIAQAGIEFQLLSTAGSIENLAKLNDKSSGVSVGLLQGGITNEDDSPDLETLGTIFYEPLWFFHRGVLQGERLDALQGHRIAIGPEGSGTRALSLELLAQNGIDRNLAELLPLTPQESAEELIKGKIDAASIVASWNSPAIRRLLTAEGIELANFPRADAYVALYPYLNKLMVPAGVGDLAKDLPPRDVSLLATRASLVVRKDLHSTIKYLLLDAAEQIHSRPGIFQEAGRFPAAESIDLPLSKEARQFYKSGRPFFQRYLPFWLAARLDRFLLILLPAIGLLYPLMRFLPFLYDWNMRRRIYRLYGELWFVEHQLEEPDVDHSTNGLDVKLDQLEKRADHLQLAKAYVGMLYILKGHIALVRKRLHKGDDI